jgi:serine/threonine-protein kinase
MSTKTELQLDQLLTRWQSGDRGSSLAEDLLGELLLRWQENRALTPEALCARCPELLAELRRRTAAVLAMEQCMDFAPTYRADPVTASMASTLDEGRRVAIPGFELLEELGSGGAGVVYKARQLQPRRLVAIKMLRSGRHARPQEMARFNIEAEALGELQHPNIVPIYQVGQAEGLPYFAMELLEGGTLARAVSSGQWAVGSEDKNRRAARLLATLARAMHAAHQRGVIHRDLKPGNVLLAADGTPKIADFGLAKRLQSSDDLTPSAAILGTLCYLAPEQTEGRTRAVGTLTDVYGLGAILYEVLTARAPFEADGDMEMLRKVLYQAVTPPRQLAPGVHADLETICLKCLDKEPARRYPSAAALADDLERFLRGEPITARPAGLVERTWKWTRRHPTAAVLTAAVLLALVVAAAAGVWYVDDRAERAAQDAQNDLEKKTLLARQDGERAVRTQYVNKNVEAALEEARRLLEEIDRHLADPLQTATLLSNPDQEWQARLMQAQKARDHAAALAGSGREGLSPAVKARQAALDQKLQLAYEDWALARALDTIRLQAGELEEGVNEPARAGPKYEAVFAGKLRMDFAAGNARALAKRLTAHRLRYVLVAALDHWAEVIPREAAVLPTLLEVARLADPDPWRDQVRDPQNWLDQTHLEQLAMDLQTARESPQVVLLLASLLDDAPRARLLAHALIGRPRDFWLHYRMAQAAPEAGEKAGHYQAALAIRPTNPVIYGSLSSVLRTKGDLDGAIAACRQALAFDPNYVKAHNTLGVALNAKGELNEALAAFRQAVECDPTYVLPHYNIGIVLRAQGDLEGAIAAYRQAIECDPTYSKAHNSLGVALYEWEDVDGALAAYRQAIVCNPKFAEAHRNLGNVLRNTGKVDEAIAAYRQAVECDPTYAQAHFNLGQALRDKKELDGAIAAFRQAVACNPKFAQAHNQLGVALYDNGDVKGALAAYRQAIACNPRYAVAYRNLGNVLRNTGDLDGSVAAYRKAVEYDPKYTLAHYNLGNALRDVGDLDVAIAAFRQAIACNPKYEFAHNGLGLALYDKGDMEEAIAAYRQAIACDPKYGEAHGNLGAALRHHGLIKESVETLQQAAKVLPKDKGIQQQLRLSQRWVELNERLPDLLEGKAKAGNPGEALEFAYLCLEPFQKEYSTALKLYKGAFAADAKLLTTYPHRYNAACAALRLAAGQDAKTTPSAEEAADLRGQAHQWLLAELQLVRKDAQFDQPATRKKIQTRLGNWKRDADLASIRDAAALQTLPAAECDAWQRFWAEVDRLLTGGSRQHQ